MSSRIAARRVVLVSLVSIVASCGEIPAAPKITDGVLQTKASSPQGLLVDPANTTLLAGQSLTLTVTNANGSAINKRATWTSSDTSIAIVVSTGIATATVTGRGTGTVTITAASGQKVGTNNTTVLPVPVRSVTLSPDSARVELGNAVQYAAVPRDSAGNPLNDRVTTWSVADASIATINSTGLAMTHARGATRVIATVEGVADTTWLIVQQTPARIELAEESIIFDALGETKQLVANVYDSRNNLITDAVVSWASADTVVATVDTGGVVTPRTTAQSAWTFISASFATLADTATVTVYRYPTSVVASPDTMFVNEIAQPGQVSGQFTTVMYDRNGYPVDGGWLLWEPLDTDVAQVAMDGSVVALANGQARIVAISFSGVQDTVLVVVDAAEAHTARLVADAAWESRTLHADPPKRSVRLGSAVAAIPGREVGRR